MNNKVLIFADINQNLIDGSTIWLENFVKIISMTTLFTEIHVLFKHSKIDTLISQEIESTSKVKAIYPCDLNQTIITTEILNTFLLANLNELNPYNKIIIRGKDHINVVLDNEKISKKLMSYWIFGIKLVEPNKDPVINKIIEKSGYIIVQTESTKRYLEVYHGFPPHRILVTPPSVNPPLTDTKPIKTLENITLSYSGKIDCEYNVGKYIQIFDKNNTNGIRLEIVGNKFNKCSSDQLFIQISKKQLENSNGISWVKGVTHKEALKLMGKASFGLCVRHKRYDNVVEVSTKLLEYMSMGVPCILNRNAVNEDILGNDYPYFCSDTKEIIPIVEQAKMNYKLYEETCKKIIKIAKQFSSSNIASKFEQFLPQSENLANKLKVAIASHDLKFFKDILFSLEQDNNITIIHDPWEFTTKRGANFKNNQNIDTIICEWCCAQAVWWSKNITTKQKLIIRLHRFELLTDHPKKVNWDNVDTLIVVSEYIKIKLEVELDLSSVNIIVLPQFIHHNELRNPKFRNSDFTIGLVGINPFTLKRPDRAVEFLEKIRIHDKRYNLRIRSAMPWNFPWIWKDSSEEKSKYVTFFQSLKDKSFLKDSISFDFPGNDMNQWYRNISIILSTSDVEGCHTSVSEAMASGALPVIFNWPGAKTVYNPKHVHSSVDEMVEYVISQKNDRLNVEYQESIIKEVVHLDFEKTLQLIYKLL